MHNAHTLYVICNLEARDAVIACVVIVARTPKHQFK